jgi:hypothetical protein
MDKLEAEGKRLASMIDKETDLNKQDSFYLAIFDIVNAWGGGSIGRFYTSTNNPTSQTRRSAYKKFIPYYKKAVEKIKEGKYTEALSIIDSDKVPGIGISFGAKHVWFWSDFFKDSGSDKEVAPVYDMRIALAFRMWGGPKTSDYDSYLKELDGVKSKYKDFTRKDVERAVFAFSDHYFDNDMTSWNSGVEETDRNYNVAEDLFDERQKHISEPKVKELDIEANTIRSVGNLMKSPPEKLSDNQKDRIHKAFDILDSYSDKQLFTYSLKGGKETSSDLRSIIGMILGREDFEKEYEDFIKSEERNKKRKEVKKARADYNRSKVSEEYDTLLENIWNKWAKWATQ